MAPNGMQSDAMLDAATIAHNLEEMWRRSATRPQLGYVDASPAGVAHASGLSPADVRSEVFCEGGLVELLLHFVEPPLKIREVSGGRLRIYSPTPRGWLPDPMDCPCRDDAAARASTIGPEKCPYHYLTGNPVRRFVSEFRPWYLMAFQRFDSRRHSTCWVVQRRRVDNGLIGAEVYDNRNEAMDSALGVGQNPIGHSSFRLTEF